MKNRLKHYKSTFIGVAIGLALFVLIYAEKLPDDWFSVAAASAPTLIGIFYKPKKK